MLTQKAEINTLHQKQNNYRLTGLCSCYGWIEIPRYNGSLENVAHITKTIMTLSSMPESSKERKRNSTLGKQTLVSYAAVLSVVTQRSSPHKQRLLSFELHSFPLSDQSGLGSHILKPFALKVNKPIRAQVLTSLLSATPPLWNVLL